MVKEKNKRYTEKITASGGINLQDLQDFARAASRRNKKRERFTERIRDKKREINKEFFDKLT